MSRGEIATVDAGLAGLCRARARAAAGPDVRALAAGDRVVSGRDDGFTLDLGFQVFLTAEAVLG